MKYFLLLLLLSCTSLELSPAKDMAVIDVNDGDTIQLSADVVLKVINGKSYRMFGYNGMIPGPLIRADKDAQFSVLFKNNLDVPTTIHLHGRRFLVLSVDGVPNDNFVWKDTVLVPKGKTIDILVDVTNPGDWMLHCHIAEHLESGMMSMLRVS